MPPAAIAMATETKPATSETRVPQIMRASTSRPTLSVPRRWARLGAARVWPRSCLRGSYGEIAGAKTATASAASRTATPNGASRAPAARRSARHRGEVASAAAGARAGAPSARPDPGVDPAIEEIHREIRQDEAHRDRQHHALDEGIVAGEYGVDDEATHAGQRVHVLRDHRAADQRAELEAQHRDHRDQR